MTIALMIFSMKTKMEYFEDFFPATIYVDLGIFVILAVAFLSGERCG